MDYILRCFTGYRRFQSCVSPDISPSQMCQITVGHQLGTMESVYFSILVLCGLFQYGSTIMCYECNSAINSLCLLPVPPDTLKSNCSEHDKGVTHTLCRKLVQHVDYGVNGRLPESRVIRSCGWDESKFKGMCYHRAGFGGRQEVCSCTTNYCNGAEEKTASITALLITAVMVAGKNVCE